MRLLVLGVLAPLLVGCGTADVAPPVSLDPAAEREPLEAGRLPALTGPEPVEIGSGAGPMVINFWASWCGPCRRELPELEALSADRDDVRVVGILHDDTADAGRAFADELGLTFPLAEDPGGRLYDRFGATGLPFTVFVDREGRVALRWFGAIDREVLTTVVDQLD